MKIQVTNTIDNSVEVFSSIQDVNNYIINEIHWFNSINENKNGNGYDESDFLIEKIN